MYPVIDIVAAARRENHSARPDAPVVPDPPHRPRRTAASLIAGLLRALARHELRMAHRIDPVCEARPATVTGPA